MRRKLLLPILLTILILVLSGCLPSVPKEIHGPTWTSQYRIPLIREKKINLGSEDGDGLGLEGVSINYHSSVHEGDEPLTFNLFEERVTVDPGTIDNLYFSGPIPPEGEYTLPEKETLAFPFEGLGDYAEVKLSSEDTWYNHIGVSLVNAVAGEKGLDIVLSAGGKKVDQVTIPPGASYEQLKISGLTITPTTDFKIEVTGSIYIDEGGTPAIEFHPGEMEIEEFTVTEIDAITGDLDLGSVEFEALKLREDDADLFEIQLKEAALSFTPVLPTGLKMETNLTVEALDQSEQVIETTNWTITLENGKRNDFPDFKKAVNKILKDGTHFINIRLDEIQFSNDGTVTITYPGEIGLEHDLTLALDYLAYGSSFEGSDGSIDMEDIPFAIEEVNLFFDVENSSPVGLALEVWFSPNPIDPDDPDSDPKAIKNKVSIAAGTENAAAKERIVLSFDPDKFTDLVEAETVYHLIKFTNQTETYDPIAADDYLKITAWADATCTINKR